MTVRDQILALPDDRKTEMVDVPEWGDLKLVVRELSVRDRNAYMQAGLERVEGEDGDISFVPKPDPLRPLRLVVMSTFEEDGVTRVFQDGDENILGDRATTVVDRLVNIAARLSGLDAPTAEKVDEAGKDSSPTETGTPSSS